MATPASTDETTRTEEHARSDDTLIAEARARFVSETAQHTLEILHDDGLYRHLRFKSPSSWMYHFDLVTWPGHLAISGDCGDFVFARTSDMFEFFAGGRGGFADARWGINPHYWSEKLQAPRRDGAQRYSEARFRACVREWLSEVSEELDLDEAAALRAAVEEQVLAEHLYCADEQEAQHLLAEFEHDGRRIYDSWEWDLREYDWSFLWCCWAIVWGIDQYRAQVDAQARSARPWWRRARSAS
jgi:hypothetical protein